MLRDYVIKWIHYFTKTFNIKGIYTNHEDPLQTIEVLAGMTRTDTRIFE